MNPYISIICPCYNGAIFINSAITSIISQPYKNWELIIINDGSTDETESICKTFEFDSRIRLITVENGGTGRARNIGIDNAKGRWVLFLDADDLLLNNSISDELVAKLDVYYAEGSDVVLTSSAKSDYELKNLIKCYLAERSYNVIPSKEFWTGIYRREFLVNKNVRFFEYKEQDVETAFRFRVVSSSNKIVSDDSIWFYLQRINEKSNTHTWNLLTLHYVKSLVYKQLLDENKTSRYELWLCRNIYKEIYAFYLACSIQVLSEDERKSIINKMYWSLILRYGMRIRKVVGIKKLVGCFIAYIKANICHVSKNVHTETVQEKKVFLKPLEEDLIRERLITITDQVAQFYRENSF